MKHLVQGFLRKFGWELSKIQPDPIPEMWQGLQWLKEQQIEVETVIDVGASNGCWSEDCMKYFPQANYLLFEPLYLHSESLDQFKDSCKQKVFIDKRAVGAEDGETYFDASDLWGGGMLGSDKGESTVKVGMTKLDSALEQHEAGAPYLLKLDTHGFEKGILEGASRMLENTSALVIECYNHEIVDDCFFFWDVCSYLQTKGFRPIKIVDVLNRKVDQSLWQMDIFFVRADWKGFENRSYQINTK